MSDRDLISCAFTDLSFKYFLGLAPEDNVIHPTTITKFRRLRLKNADFLDHLISKSIEIAFQKESLHRTQLLSMQRTRNPLITPSLLLKY